MKDSAMMVVNFMSNLKINSFFGFNIVCLCTRAKCVPVANACNIKDFGLKPHAGKLTSCPKKPWQKKRERQS